MTVRGLAGLACPIVDDASLAAGVDADGDGFRAEQFGGEDCDDADVAVNPDAVDHWRDGTDQDCDDQDPHARPGASGQDG